MLKIENVEVVGYAPAIRGARNPMNSWDKSDSHSYCGDYPVKPYFVGKNDLALMSKLANAGDDHGKAIRYLDVYLDIEAPLYFWKEFKTYRTGRNFLDDENDYDYDDDAILENYIETNSCSTMHKIHSKEFTVDDFSHEHLDHFGMRLLENTINILNRNRELFLETKDKKYWWQMIQLLTNSYHQRRTVKLNYQVLRNMYKRRKNHKLDEWKEFCLWIETLPYSELITGEKNNDT